METTDTNLLSNMREMLGAYRSGTLSVGELADQLLLLREHLQFRDDAWEHELTQHIATLDSASTFRPKDDEQVKQLSHAAGTAVDELLRLIESKLV